MELIGRITANATVNQTKEGRKVVNFSVAINDSFKTKDNEIKKLTTYVQCSYWVNPGIAQYLTKGTLVELYGRIGVNAWANTEGEPKAALNFHVNTIKLHGGGRVSKPENIPLSVSANETAEGDDDLPF